MLDHFVQYVGSSPDASPAILCAIGHMQMEEGIWYPMGGTRAVPQALVKLATELGVVFHTETDVTKILTDVPNHGGRAGGRVTGLVTSRGAVHTFDAVVSNSDAVRTHRELVGGAAARTFDHKRDYEPACSGVVLYLGLNKRYDHIAHHDFVFSRDAHEEFHHIYDLGEPAPDPTCYLAATAATDPTSAPAGGEALYVLVHTPYLRSHHDWSKMFPAYRQVILDKLKRTAGMEDIEDRIVFAAGYPRPLSRAERSNLRNIKPWSVQRSIQARQPQQGSCGDVSGGRGGTSWSRNAYGDDVGLDRRGLRRPGCTELM
jgi:diapolycopene oxygenase